jgi:hypothetical protein
MTPFVRKPNKNPSLTLALSCLTLAAFVACGGDDEPSGPGGPTGGSGGRPPEQTGAACEVDDDCFLDVLDGELQGEALCLTRVRDGYCTHTCESDADCCAASGECKTSLAQVCSPFESASDMMCFLSCESEDVAAADGVDNDQEYCQRYASPDFICRSSGGGSGNRKICVPGDCGIGADCGDANDCSSDLECLSAFRGGYCGLSGCLVNDDCPDDALCVVASNGENHCYKPCSTASDCSFCRRDGLLGACTADVSFAEDGTTGSVCVPVPL